MTIVVARQDAVPAARAGARRWMYLGEDALWPIEAARGPLAGLPRVVTRDALQARAQAMRGPYLDWIGRLGRLNDSFAWWASELAAKNVYTYLFQRLCAAGAAADLLEDDLLVVCATSAQAETVAQLARARDIDVQLRTGRRTDTRRAAREVGHAALHAVRRRFPDQAPTARGDTLLVTWVDDRSFDQEGRYRDFNFGPLADLLRERGERPSLLARLLPSADRSETLRRLAACGEHVYLADALLTPADWRAARRAARAFAPQLPDDAEVGGVPAAALARELVRDQRISHTGALTYGPLVRRLASLGARPDQVVIPWEGHAWETALIAAFRRELPDVDIVAYDNLNFSSFALSLYPAANELEIRPLPDRVVTNGPTFARVLETAGFPSSRIRVGCALRHSHLYDENGSLREPRRSAAEYVLAAGSIDAGQTIEMAAAAHVAFGDEMLVKLHPASDAARIRALLPHDVRYADAPITELLTRARAMVYTYSIVPYEALAAGVPPVFFQSQTLLDLDQLEPTPEVRWVGSTPDELRNAVSSASVVAMDGSWTANANSVVRRALAPADARCVDALLRERRPAR